ncbi:winged helix-turn-helix domain-containing protein [Haloparvum sedimenti]|uniref:winged helix-turn-helix domain-containing protein n=1 Tax=Haloparvum sedimenti TaxID=1678448 RepID=UPI001C3FF962|nr:winged helix-turn-helix domain-containing protein [Haloparvum sedimenti]
MLEPRQLNEADRKILDELREGRASPSYLAERTGVEQTYINQRLRRLDEHGHVENLARGLWELVDDPRDDVDRADATADDVAELEREVADLQARIESAQEWLEATIEAITNVNGAEAEENARAAQAALKGDEDGED